MQLRFSKTAAASMLLVLVLSGPSTIPAAAASGSSKPTLTVTSAVTSSTSSFPTYSDVIVTGCGYAPNNVYGVRIGEFVAPLNNWWADAPVDANGCINVTMQVYWAGSYSFSANITTGSGSGGKIKVVASETITVS